MTFENVALGTSMTLAISAGAAMVRRTGVRRIPALTLVIALLTIAGFVLQLADAGVLEALERDGRAIAAGQWERLFTTLLVQDGGWVGFMSNLAGLALVGALAEQLVCRRAWIGLYLLPAFASELIALNWQPIGAGNSVAWMGLAGAIFYLALRQAGALGLSILGSAGLAIGALLTSQTNIHGPAMLLGALLSWGCCQRDDESADRLLAAPNEKG